MKVKPKSKLMVMRYYIDVHVFSSLVRMIIIFGEHNKHDNSIYELLHL